MGVNMAFFIFFKYKLTPPSLEEYMFIMGYRSCADIEFLKEFIWKETSYYSDSVVDMYKCAHTYRGEV